MPKYTSEIEAELAAATKLKRKRGESAEAWKTRLVDGYSVLPQKVFDALSDDTYEWAEAAVKAADTKNELPAWPDADPEPEDDVEDDDDEEEEAEDDEPEDDDDEEEDDDLDEDDESEEDEDDGEEEEAPPPRKPKGLPKVKNKSGDMVDQHNAFRELVVVNYGRSHAELAKLASAAGIDLSEGSMNSIIYHTKQSVEMLESVHGITVPKWTPTAEKPKSKPKRTRKAKPASPSRKRAKKTNRRARSRA